MLNTQKLNLDIYAYSTITAETVNPAVVDPIPVVKTDLGITLEANLNICDFPVPGSPTSSKCGSDLILVPVSDSF